MKGLSSMKYTLFYIQSDMVGMIKSDYAFPDCSIDISTGRPFDYSLYAVTSSKKYARIFRETRNMHYFIEREAEFDDLEKENLERDLGAYFIHKHPFKTIYQDGDHKEIGQLILPVVNFEYDVIDLNGEYVFSDLLEMIDNGMSDDANEMSSFFLTSGGINIFKEPFRHILDTINFQSYYEDYHPLEEVCYMPAENSFNQLMLYAICYSGIYTKGGIQRLCEYGDFI